MKVKFCSVNISVLVFTFMCGSVVVGVEPQATVWTESEWLPFNGRALDSFSDYVVNPANLELSKYGGWKAHQVEATGFFRVEKINGRWWAIDPEGYLYLHKAVTSAGMSTETADEIHQLLVQNGFNGLGCWSDENIIQQSSLQEDTPLAYCPKVSFVATYKNQRSPSNVPIPVFDDEWPAFCVSFAQNFAKYVGDPHVFGYFSDNEISWITHGLENHVAITDPNDKNYITAVDFLASRGKTPSNYDGNDEHAYTALLSEAYFSAVASAIKAVDPNHMYLGPRLNRSWTRTQGFLEAAAPYLDIVGINHYHRWGTRDAQTKSITEWTGKPVMVSEYYAMEEHNPETVTGAGWRVTDQPSRGLFYHNYIIRMAETKNCVGWHWFKFQDVAKGNGIVDVNGNPYEELLVYMQQLNSQIYDFINYLDARPSPDVTLTAEADAYYKGSVNYGASGLMEVRLSNNESSHSEAYLRFDLSTLAENVELAKIYVYGVSSSKRAGAYQAELVTDDSWDEMTINSSNNPPGSILLGTWGAGDDIELDVTDVLRDAVTTDDKLSIRIMATYNNGQYPFYGSREHSNPLAHPKLLVYYGSDYRKDTYSYTTEAEDYNTESGTVTEVSDDDGGYHLGYIENGDWSAYYNVDFGALANEFQARIASDTSGGNIEIRLDSPTGTLLGTCPVNGTGDWQNWATKRVSISEVSGIHDMYLVYTGDTGYLFNINWFKLIGSVPTPPASPTGLVASAGYNTVSIDWADNDEPNLESYSVYRSSASGGPYFRIASGITTSDYVDNNPINDITFYYVVTAVDTDNNESGYGNEESAMSQSIIDAFATIEAEDYDAQSGIDTEPCDEGGQNIGYIENGDWSAYYNVDFSNGVNEFQARVASDTAGGNIEIRLDSSTGTLLGTCSVNGTGDWQNWVTNRVSFDEATGVHDVYLVYTGGTGYLFNLNWFAFSGPASCCAGLADFDCDGIVDGDDLSYMADVWLTDDPTADLAQPADGIVNLLDFSVLAEEWLNSPCL